MSSFSSVIRKPGGNVAPKVAPRRNIVRKAQPRPSPQSVTETAALSEESVANAQPEPSQAREHLRRSRAHLSTQPADNQSQSLLNQDGSVESTRERASDARTLQNTLETPHAIGSSTSEIAQVDNASTTSERDQSVSSIQDAGVSATPNWPKQKSKPQSNRAQSRAVSNAADNVRVEDDGDSTQIPTPVTQPSGKPSPRSKRKQPPRAGADLILSQPSIPTPPTTQPSRSPDHDRASSVLSQRAPSVASQRSEARSEAEEALDRVNSQLLKITEIAASIERGSSISRSQSRARQSTAPSDSATEFAISDEPDREHRPRKRRKTNNNNSQAIQDQAAEIVANAVRGADLDSTTPRGRRRRRTPEDPETHEIEEANIRMGDICDDKQKWGRKSEKEKEIHANWPEILRRRKEDAARRLLAAQEGRRKKEKSTADVVNDNQQDENAETDLGAVPVVVIENGVAVIASREIDRHAETQRRMEKENPATVLEDLDIYKRVNSHTIASKSQIAPGQHWDNTTTDLFYQGLRMFGTDFKMISNMIPGKNRRQVKLKYNIEERLNWPRIQRCLSQKEEVNLDEYAQLTGLEMSNVADVYKQMEEDEKRLRDEDEARRRDEGIISQAQAETADGEADIVIPSIESQDSETAPAVEGTVQSVAADRQSTAGFSRLGSTTTGRQTAQPPSKKKQPKKSASASRRGRQAASKNRGFEGVEERLGDVGDIGIPTT